MYYIVYSQQILQTLKIFASHFHEMHAANNMMIKMYPELLNWYITDDSTNMGPTECLKLMWQLSFNKNLSAHYHTVQIICDVVHQVE